MDEWLSNGNDPVTVISREIPVSATTLAPMVSNDYPVGPVECSQFETCLVPPPAEIVHPSLGNSLSTMEPAGQETGEVGVGVGRKCYKSSKEERRSIASDFCRDGRITRCKLCAYETRRAEHMYRHIRSVHRGNRQFSCGRCGRKFVRKDCLKSHLKICRGPAHQIQST